MRYARLYSQRSQTLIKFPAVEKKLLLYKAVWSSFRRNILQKTYFELWYLAKLQLKKNYSHRKGASWNRDGAYYAYYGNKCGTRKGSEAKEIYERFVKYCAGARNLCMYVMEIEEKREWLTGSCNGIAGRRMNPNTEVSFKPYRINRRGNPMRANRRIAVPCAQIGRNVWLTTHCYAENCHDTEDIDKFHFEDFEW